MRADEWQRVEELFHQVVELAPEARDRRLDAACEGDPELRRRVDGLLKADAAEQDVVADGIRAAFSDSAVSTLTGGLRSAPPDDDEGAPSRVGAYKIVGRLGRGGLGTVYLAERDDEHFRKQVALKVVRRGLDTDDVLTRFRYERQILARFEHANIARLLDGGSLPDGRPFFVMEHVDGLPVDDYCAAGRLDLRARLELFREICAAVGYAHRNLVVHRDLKPSNILVADDGAPKLLDFGIAKLLDTDENRATQLHTTEGLLLLTPEFAAPEQVLGQPVTTQTDVYALGVLLYRLLTGRPPYTVDRGRLTGAVEAICHTRPQSPSAVLELESLVVAGLTPPNAGPRELKQHRKALKGDLDLVLLKALAKDPARRYASVDALSEDLRRHLDGDRVSARPESFTYRLTVLLRRHRAVASVLATGIIVLLTVVLTYTALLRVQRNEALSQADTADRVASLLVDLLEMSDPDRTRGEQVTVREMLDEAAAKLKNEPDLRPEVRSNLMQLIGLIYGNLGLYREAEPLLEEALALAEGHGRGGELADALAGLGDLKFQIGDDQEAERLLSRALELRRAEKDEKAAEKIGRTLNNLGAVYQRLGRIDDAELHYRQAWKLQLEFHGAGHQETLMTRSNLATLLYRAKRTDDAEDLARGTLDAQIRHLGGAHPDVAVSRNTLVAILVDQGHLGEASELLQQVLERQKELYGAEHPKVATSLTNLGALLFHQRRFDEAEATYLEALDLQARLFGENHALVVTTLKNLADVKLYTRRDPEGCERILRRALRILAEIEGDPVDVASTWIQLGELEVQRRRLADARIARGRAQAIHEARPDEVPAGHKARLAKLIASLDDASLGAEREPQ